MQTAILVLHILICVILIILVLLQAGREGMGVVFGGGGNNSVFGSQGAGGILSKLTAFLAVLFVVTSLGYNIMFSSNSKSETSVLDVQFEETPTNPATSPVPNTNTQSEPVASSDSAATTPNTVATTTDKVTDTATDKATDTATTTDTAQ